MSSYSGSPLSSSEHASRPSPLPLGTATPATSSRLGDPLALSPLLFSVDSFSKSGDSNDSPAPVASVAFAMSGSKSSILSHSEMDKQALFLSESLFSTRRKPWQDLLSIFVFAAVFVATFGLFVHFIIQAGTLDEAVKIKLKHDFHSKLSTSCIVTALFVILYGSLYYAAPAHMIFGSFLISVLINCGVGGMIIYSHGSLVSLVYIGWSLVCILTYLFNRKLVAFSSAIMDVVMISLSDYTGIIVLSLGMTVAIVLYVVFSVASFVCAYYLGTDWWILVLLSASFLWTLEVFYNVVNVSISGLYARCYFFRPIYGIMPPALPSPTTGATSAARKASQPPKATWACVRQSLTTSFGSIALGSLIEMVCQGPYYVLRAFYRRHSHSCTTRVYQQLSCHYNIFAYSHVAIHGKSYLQSARDTWQLAQASDVESLIQEQISGAALSMSYISVGIASSGVGFYLVHEIASFRSSDVLLVSVICGVIGMMLMTVVSAVIHSAVRALFVCYAESPAVLKRNHLALYRQFAKESPFCGPDKS